MSTTFDTYLEDFNQITEATTRLIDSIPSQVGDYKRSAISEAQGQLKEADDILRQLTLEGRTLSGSAKEDSSRQVNAATAKLKDLKTQLSAASSKFDSEAAKQQLFSGAGREMDMTDQRQRLLDSTTRLQGSSKLVDDSYRMALETEEVGMSILSDLHGQRGKLESAQRGLRDIDDSISRARKILQSMGRRLVTNKIMMFCIIFALIGLIILLIVVKVKG